MTKRFHDMQNQAAATTVYGCRECISKITAIYSVNFHVFGLHLIYILN